MAAFLVLPIQTSFSFTERFKHIAAGSWVHSHSTVCHRSAAPARSIPPLYSRPQGQHAHSDFFFWKFHFEAQRIGEAVCQVRNACKQVDVDDLRVVEVLSENDEVVVVYRMEMAR